MSKSVKSPIRLEDCWLYAVSSKTDLAHRVLSTSTCKFSVQDLEMLALDAGNFRLFDVRKDGKKRGVQEPKQRLQKLHRRVHKLLSRVQVPEYLHSTVRERSYLTNAQAHDPAARTIKLDVKKFFQSVPREAIFRFFSDTMKCRRHVAGLMADILTFDARLPTGSSASPIIAYYAFKPMFDEIEAFAKAYGLTMTCYVDDITMSGTNATPRVLHEARKIVARYGLKTHKMRAFEAGDAKVITGVCNTPGGRRVPNRLHLKIKEGFDTLRKATTAKERENALRTLIGRLHAAGQIEPIFSERARTLRAQFRANAARAEEEAADLLTAA